VYLLWCTCFDVSVLVYTFGVYVLVYLLWCTYFGVSVLVYTFWCIFFGVSVVVCLFWCICFGVYVLVYMFWCICFCVSVFVYLFWCICFGVSVVVYLFWCIRFGVSVFVYLFWCMSPPLFLITYLFTNSWCVKVVGYNLKPSHRRPVCNSWLTNTVLYIINSRVCTLTALQAGRSWIRFPVGSLGFFNDLVLPTALCSWGRLSLW
jgi:hypothetical protein